MSKVTKTYCDCCGNELTEGIELNECLFFSVITERTKSRMDYCYECGNRLASVMNAEMSKICKEKGIEFHKF